MFNCDFHQLTPSAYLLIIHFLAENLTFIFYPSSIFRTMPLNQIVRHHLNLFSYLFKACSMYF